MTLLCKAWSDKPIVYERMSRIKGHLIIARIVGVAILLGLPILFHCLLPIMPIVPKPYTYCGIALMLLGLVLGILAAMTFQGIGASFQLHGKSSTIATSGPFRISRNPMYLSMLIWLAGLGYFFLGSFNNIPVSDSSLPDSEFPDHPA